MATLTAGVGLLADTTYKWSLTSKIKNGAGLTLPSQTGTFTTAAATVRLRRLRR